MLATRQNLTAALIAVALATLAGNAIAQTPPSAAGQPTQVVRPADLMTQAERDAFRKQMEAATTAEERQNVRDAHRAALEQRAKDKGVTLAEPRGRGGMGGGMGGGSGHGPGAGPSDRGAYSQLFTEQERSQFRDQMSAATTAEERQKVRDEHRALAETRAKEKGIALPAPGARDGHRGHGAGHRHNAAYRQLFTSDERDRFREQMRSAQTVEERQKLRDEHRAVAEARAREKGVALPPQGPRGPKGPAPAAPNS